MTTSARTPSGAPAVTLADLGAWLVKGNADRSDLLARLRRDPHVDGWCVQPGYRARLMRAGQPAVLWVSGSRGPVPYGVAGCGVVTGPAVPEPDGRRWRVPLDLTVDDPERWLPRPALRRDARLAGLEVLRQPQASNPSYLTVAQFAAVQDHLRRRPHHR